MTVTPLEEQPSIANVTRVLRESARWVLLAGVVGAVAGLAASIVVPPRWTAKLTVQIGQVVMANANGTPAKLTLENQLTAAERVNQPNFRLNVIKTLGLPEPDTGSRKADLAFDSLRASAERSPDLITLQASSYSKEEALEIVDAAFKDLSTTHRTLFDQSTEVTRHELARAQDNLSAADAEYRNATNTLKSDLTTSAAAAGARDVLVSNTVSLLRAQVSDLHQQVNAYRDALSPVQSYPTRAVAPAYVPERPSTPSRTVWVLGGVVIGLLVGTSLALLRDTLKGT